MQLVLYQPPNRPWGTPNTSPFCGKLETYLRITEIPYTTAPFKRGDMPKGKIPYVSLDGKFVGDSQLIIEELERRLEADGKPALDRGLAAHDRAIARIVRRMIEEGLYFVGLYTKWEIDEGYATTREAFKTFVPAFIIPIVRRAQRKKLIAQGTGRHTFEEVMAIGAADLDAVAEILGEQPFLLGDAPRTVDCTVYAFLETILGFPSANPVKAGGLGHPNLVAYRKRIRERYWKDLPPLDAAGA